MPAQSHVVPADRTDHRYCVSLARSEGNRPHGSKGSGADCGTAHEVLMPNR